MSGMRKIIVLAVLMLLVTGCMRGEEKPAQLPAAASLKDALPTTLPPETTPPPTNAPATPAPTQPPQTAVPPPTTAPPAPKTGLQVVWKHEINDTVNAVDMTDSRVVSGDVNHYVRVFNLEDGKLLLKKEISKRMVEDVGMTADGEYIAIAGSRLQDGDVYLIRKTGTQSWSYSIGDEVQGIAISDDGNYIAAGSQDQNVYLLNRNKKLLWTFPTAEGTYGIWDVDISSSGDYVVAGGDARIVYLLDKEGNLVWNRTLERRSYIYGVAISPDASYIAAVAQDHYVYFFDMEGNLLWKYQTAFSNYGVAISKGGERVIVSSEDKNIYYLDKSGKLIQNLNLGVRVRGVAISEDGKKMAVATYRDSATSRGGEVYLIEFISE